MGYGALLVVATAFGLVGCGSSSSAAEEQPKPVSSASFASQRYGYTLTLPSGWRREPTPGTWNGALYPGEPGVDTFVDSSATRRVFVAARRVRGAVTGPKWAAEIAAGVPPVCSRSDRTAVTVAASPAQIAVYECSDGYVAINATFLRAGRGFAIGWVSPSEPAGAVARGRQQFDAVLGSFAFANSNNKGGS